MITMFREEGSLRDKNVENEKARGVLQSITMSLQLLNLNVGIVYLEKI